MVHSFFNILFSKQHYIRPFVCPCDETNSNRTHSHCLTLSQKVATLALALLFAIATFGIGGIAVFYILTAAFKARNSVWTEYAHASYDRSRYAAFIPEWWGIPRKNRTFMVNEGSHNTYIPTRWEPPSRRQGHNYRSEIKNSSRRDQANISARNIGENLRNRNPEIRVDRERQLPKTRT
jgi:hypothetical protein